jgi:hypothetical protein
MLNFASKLTVFLIFFAPLAGCGYHLRESGTPLGPQIESLAIPMMQSTASYPGFETTFTGIIRREFVSHARMPLVDSGRARAVLRGYVYDIRTDPLTYSLIRTEVHGRTTTHEVTSSRWLSLKLDAELIDAQTGETIWKNRGMEEKAAFRVSADPLKMRDNRQKALESVAERLAERIYQQTMERF